MRPYTPTSRSGSIVTHAPASIHSIPVTLKTVSKNFAPASKPTAAKNSCHAEFAECEVCVHRHVARQPSDPSKAPEHQGNNEWPARPSRTGCGSPGKAIGIVPTTIPRNIPMNIGMK